MMQKNKKRATRIHHYLRRKAKVVKNMAWMYWDELKPSQIGKLTNTRVPCSCGMCTQPSRKPDVAWKKDWDVDYDLMNDDFDLPKYFDWEKQ
tara:strand:+ start:668 stop:943 length:276 start_codon:yes stop_codon:yes gene_type:complete